MLMMWVTKVFNPGAPRIGQITRNFVLPRSVAVPDLLGGILGGLIGIGVGVALDPLLLDDVITSVILGAGCGGTVGVMLVNLRPWQGEHIHRVAAVRAMALSTARTLICPGSGLPARHSGDLGTLACPECGRGHSSTEPITPRHEWRRRVYLGMMPIPPPIIGEVEITPGSSPTAVSRR